MGCQKYVKFALYLFHYYENPMQLWKAFENTLKDVPLNTYNVDINRHFLFFCSAPKLVWQTLKLAKANAHQKP